MVLPDTAPESTPASRTAENDDVGDAFARSPSDALRSVSEHGRGLRSQELGSIRSSSRFAGSSSGIYFLRTVCDAIAKAGTSENLTSAPAVNLRFIPGEDERVGDSGGCIWYPTEVTSVLDAAWPSFDDLVALISSTYIRGWHCLLPFLQAENILQTLEDACLQKTLDHRTPQSVCIRSIISISLLDRRQTSGEDATLTTPLPPCLVFRSLEDCNSSIHPLLGDNSLKSLQGMLSAQIFMISIMELRSASRLGGLIVRMAFDLGLHRCPCRYRLSFGETEVSIRRRIFWTVYNLDRYLCQALGLPLGIRDEDVDVCLPNNEIHRSPEEKVAEENSIWDNRLVPLILLSKYSGIKGRLMEISNKCMLHRISDAEQALRNVHVDILKWRNEVQDFTAAVFGDDDDLDNSRNSSTQSEGKPTVITPAHRLIFQIKYHELLLLMHRPALSAKSTNETYPVAMLTCLSSARAIISLTKRYLSRYRKDEGKVEYPILWHVMLSTIWMSGLVVIFAAFEGSIALDSANRDIQSTWSILEHLSLRLPGKPKACEVALRALFQLMCRKRGFSGASTSPSSILLGKRKRVDVAPGPSRPNTTNLNDPSSITPIEARAPFHYSPPLNNPTTMENSESFQPGQPHFDLQANTNFPIAPSPSQGSLDENQVLWLLDVPNLLDDQSLNFFPGQAGPSVDLRATSEFNADTLFNSLRMNMGDEDSFYFHDNGPPFV
ncbi:hypothetical protein TWF481_008488 [Arthrobotrys musiformis]|uniref:Xylanolytic transcriptional activator regulatory domain-containing protein n=1 Tax=Arthrobotrys musiformis TaxID=47236 RepID=A0AAV9W7A6_9PEZI